eukprot:m.43712 g.43712  ORF g.43712 m.43712 type:complete len:123 (+) comp33466_c0_seq1:16-384(+)
MADRVTQLQESVNELAEHFCNSIGVLQLSQPGEQSGTAEHAALFASLIARKAKDIDTLIESLPSDECTSEIQAESLRTLEEQNREAGRKLEEAIRHGEDLLLRIRQALKEIADTQLCFDKRM